MLGVLVVIRIYFPSVGLLMVSTLLSGWQFGDAGVLL